MTWCTREAKIKKTTACVTFVCVERLLIASNYWSWILFDFNSGMVGGLVHDLQFKSTCLVWKKINFSMWGFWIEIHISLFIEIPLYWTDCEYYTVIICLTFLGILVTIIDYYCNAKWDPNHRYKREDHDYNYQRGPPNSFEK